MSQFSALLTLSERALDNGTSKCAHTHTHTHFYAGTHELLIGLQKFHLPVFVKGTPDTLQTGVKQALKHQTFILWCQMANNSN